MRESRFPVCAINIAARSHPEGAYEKLLEAAFRLSRPLPIHGDRHALILSFDKNYAMHLSDRKVLRGVLATFIDLDIDAPWFDIKALRVVKKDEKQNIQIPDALRPNMAEFIFLFDPKSHILVCQSETVIHGKRRHLSKMTGTMLAGFFGELLSSAPIKKEFGEIEVTAVPDVNQVEQILTSKLRKIHLVLRAPNSDTVEHLQDRIKKRMRKLNASQIEESVTADATQILEPDEDLKNLARVAAMNGRVDATIVAPGGRSKQVSTIQKPAVFEVIRSEKERDAVAMDRAGEKAFDAIKRFNRHVGGVGRRKGRGAKKRT